MKNKYKKLMLLVAIMCFAFGFVFGITFIAALPALYFAFSKEVKQDESD